MTVEIRKDARRAVRPAGRRLLGALDRHQERHHADPRQQRRHGGHRRHLRGEIRNDVTQVPFLGNLPILGYLFKQTGTIIQEDRTPDLPHAAHRQGIRSTRCGERDDRRRPTPPSHPMPRFRCTGAICFWSDCPVRESPRSARQLARRLRNALRRRRCRTGASAGRLDSDHLRNRRRGRIPRPRGGGRWPSSRSSRASCCPRAAALCCAPANRARLKENGTGDLSARRPGSTLGARTPQPEPPAAAVRRPARASRRALCASATRSIARSRIT